MNRRVHLRINFFSRVSLRRLISAQGHPGTVVHVHLCGCVAGKIMNIKLYTLVLARKSDF